MMREMQRPAGRFSVRDRVGRALQRWSSVLLGVGLLGVTIGRLPGDLPSDDRFDVAIVEAGHAHVMDGSAAPQGHQLLPANGWTAAGLESRETKDRFQPDRRTRARSLTGGRLSATPVASARVRATAARRLARIPDTDAGHARQVRAGHISIPPPHSLQS